MKWSSIVFLLSFCSTIYAQESALDPVVKQNIQQLIQVFQLNQPEAIAEVFHFPLERYYPVPDIRDKQEFMRRYHEVVDIDLQTRIANSTLEQWSEVGWRGIMLDNGIVWLSDDGEKISGINHTTLEGRQVMEAFLKKDKDGLHPDLRKFHRPAYKILTKRYFIRVDEFEDNTYRYASWKKGKEESSLPDLVLRNGEYEAEGTGGNHRFVFTNGIYQYIVYRNVMGEGEVSEITLEVLKNDKVILKEDGILLLN